MSATTEDPLTASREHPESRAQQPDEPGSGALGPELDAQFEWRDDVLVVHLAGELDIYTVPPLRRQIARHDQPQTALVVDLLHVSLIDSRGLGLLVSLRNNAAVSEGKDRGRLGRSSTQEHPAHHRAGRCVRAVGERGARLRSRRRVTIQDVEPES